MRVLWNELKKILTWKMLVLLIFINSVLYFLLIEFYIENFPNGSGIYSYEMGIEMIEKYGTTMDEEEFIDFKKAYANQVEEATQYLQSREEFVEVGLDTYEEFLAYDWWNAPQEIDELRSDVFINEKVDLFWELQERESLIRFYEGRKTIPHVLSEKKRQRFEELIAQEKFGVYPEVVMMNFKSFIANVAIAILFSVVLVISPTIVKDRTRQVVAIQYTTRKGRNLFKTKLLAGSIATFILITALLIVYFSLYSLNNTSMYFDVRVNTFIANESWFDPTFFQFILLCVAGIYIIGLVFGLLSMVFSSLVPNMVSLIGIQIPFVVGFLLIGLYPLVPHMISIWNSKWLALIAYSVMILLTLVGAIMLWKREKKMDIVL
ncbi:hypothetical protein QT711_05935 [Sporosarcina saromensis]|uniref:ABC-2 family transporter protein n=1 Tax=Sporosarcina saromensis TaxID=359365 RepID=A0ABU4GAV1_9BACL|nr:hypothetical protein [Sporosarcina saromensis]MDW0112717.1 hypothetical protein [Sporosarcina saromensis]